MDERLPEIRLTRKQIEEWRATPPATPEELEAIRNETPLEKQAIADAAFKSMFPAERPFVYSRLRHPPRN